MNTLPRHDFNPAAAPVARPRPGAGTRLVATPHGFAYSSRRGGQSFAHPFKPALGPASISFARGLVEGFEPQIDGVFIGGLRDGGAPPALKLDPSVANASGESWCCLEVTPNTAGKLDENSRIEIVHTAQPISTDPAVGRGRGGTVCLILWRDRRPYQVHEVLYFNVRYQRITPAQGIVEHLFF